jgi:hypothetical protein
MFNAKQLKDFIDAKPFRPFKVLMSDGRSYEVPNHDAAFVTQNKIEIGLDLNKNGIARRSVYCAILHIASLEELQTA